MSKPTPPAAPSAALEKVRVKIGEREHRHAGVTLGPGTEVVMEKHYADSLVAMKNGEILGPAAS